MNREIIWGLGSVMIVLLAIQQFTLYHSEFCGRFETNSIITGISRSDIKFYLLVTFLLGLVVSIFVASCFIHFIRKIILGEYKYKKDSEEFNNDITIIVLSLILNFYLYSLSHLLYQIGLFAQLGW